MPDRVGYVVLSSFQNCRNLPVVAFVIDSALWKTPEGIGIGSSKEEVLRAYHQPVSVNKLSKGSDIGVIAGIHTPGASKTDVGDTSLLYSCLVSAKQGCTNDLRAAEMGFSHDKLVWISISNTP